MRMYADMLCLAIKYRIVCCPSFPTVLFAFCFSWEGRTVISRNFVIDSLKEYILGPCDDCDEENMNHKYYVDEMLNSLVSVEHSEQVAMAIEKCLDYDSDSSYSSDDEPDSRCKNHGSANDDSEFEVDDMLEEEDFTDGACTPKDLKKVLELRLPEIEIKERMENLVSTRISEILKDGTITFIEKQLIDLMKDLEHSDKDINEAKISMFHWLKSDEQELSCADFRSSGLLRLWERASMTRELAPISKIAQRILTLVASEAEVERERYSHCGCDRHSTLFRRVKLLFQPTTVSNGETGHSAAF